MGGSALLDMGTPLTSLKHNIVLLKDGISHISVTQKNYISLACHFHHENPCLYIFKPG